MGYEPSHTDTERANRTHLIVFPYWCQSELDRFGKLADSWTELTKTELKLEFLFLSRWDISPSVNIPVKFSPHGGVKMHRCVKPKHLKRGRPSRHDFAKHMFCQCMEFIEKNYEDDGGFVFWMEHDVVFVKSDWLDTLDAEWTEKSREASPPLLLGHLVTEKNTSSKNRKDFVEHINGVACYSKSIAKYVNLRDSLGRGYSFDVYLSLQLKNLNLWGHVKPSSVWDHRLDYECNSVRMDDLSISSQTRIVHGCKSDLNFNKFVKYGKTGNFNTDGIWSMNQKQKFDMISSAFCKRLDVDDSANTLEKLVEFCKWMGIDENNIYNKLVNEPKIMHMYCCFLKTNELRTVPSKKIPTKSNYEAVIIEDRKLPHLEFLIRNCIYRLSDNWSHTLVCTSGSYEKMVAFCRGIDPNINVIKFDAPGMTQNSYNNLMLSRNFWDRFESENILIYQQDSVIFRNGIDAFLGFDYIGAPWLESQTDNSVGVGNGGFSLRKRSKMLECIEKIKPSELILSEDTIQYMKNTKLENPPEDVFFSKVLVDYNLGNVADRETAKKFSEERIRGDDSFAGHQYWLSDCDKMFRLFNPYQLYDWSYFQGEASSHRGGWKSLLSHMMKSKFLRIDCGVALLDVAEKYFVWDKGNAIDREWVGISHMTPNTPYYLNIAHIDRLLENENFLKSLKYCKALVVLSGYMKNYIENKLKKKINIVVLKHPVIEGIKKFNLNVFFANPNKKVIQLGQQMRYISSIYRLKSLYPKVWMYGHPDLKLMHTRRDEEMNMLNLDADISSVEMKYTKNFKEYDDLIGRNIILVDLMDASANNAVLELISANIPFFVKKLPAVVEYVGEEYPMFFSDLSKVEGMLANEENLKKLYRKTYSYLVDLDKSDLDYDYFSEKLLEIVN